MICSVKEYLLLSQCNIGNALPWFSLCLALLVRDEGRHLGVFFFFLCFVFVFLKLENLHSRRMSTSTPEAPGQPSGACPQQGLLSVPLGHNFTMLNYSRSFLLNVVPTVTVILYYLAHCRDVI